MSATDQDLAETVAPEEVSTAVDTSQEVEAVTSEDEMDRLDPIPTTYTFEDGYEVDIERLRTRQFFKLLRIITRGGGTMLGQLRLDPNQGVDVFTENLIALVVFAVPEAEDETIEFLRSMVKPKPGEIPDDTPAAQVPKAARVLEASENRRVDSEFTNMEIGDLVGLTTAIVRREAPELKALGKRLAETLKFNQAVQAQSSDTTPSLEASQEPST